MVEPCRHAVDRSMYGGKFASPECALGREHSFDGDKGAFIEVMLLTEFPSRVVFVILGAANAEVRMRGENVPMISIRFPHQIE